MIDVSTSRGAALASGNSNDEHKALSQLSARVEQERRLYDTVLSNTPDLVYVFDLNHRFIYANKALLAMWGRTAQEAHGRNCLELGYEPWHAALHDREIDQVIATKQSIRGEVPFTGTNGRRIYDYIFVPVLGSNGEVEAVAGTTRDITERKQVEEKLEQMVADRTAELRGTIAELETFSYSIAHDLRAPLRSLQGFSDILLSDYAKQLDMDGQDFVRRIHKAAGRMDKLIQDVLNYSRIVRGESPLQRTPVEPLIRTIIDTHPPFAPDRATVTVDGQFPAVIGNEAMLTQIFSNLIGNAVKFVRPGMKPCVRIWAEPQQSSVRVFVRDQGIGISADQHKKIFDIFQQAETGYGGTGIGLAIVKKAVERLGGRAGLESQRDQGSTFWVELRCA